MKKIIRTFGAIALTAAPIAAVVSCGKHNDKPKDQVSMKDLVNYFKASKETDLISKKDGFKLLDQIEMTKVVSELTRAFKNKKTDDLKIYFSTLIRNIESAKDVNYFVDLSPQNNNALSELIKNIKSEANKLTDKDMQDKVIKRITWITNVKPSTPAEQKIVYVDKTNA